VETVAADLALVGKPIGECSANQFRENLADASPLPPRSLLNCQEDVVIEIHRGAHHQMVASRSPEIRPNHAGTRVMGGAQGVDHVPGGRWPPRAP
jgi:hypothetical protein